MTKEFIRKIVNMLLGKTDSNDSESYKLALAEGIVGRLKDNDFIVKANRLVLGCESGCYEDALKGSGPVIVKYLKNQGGAMRSLAGRIDVEDGILIHISPAPENIDVKTIPAKELPVSVWFFLEKVEKTECSLVLSRNKVQEKGWRKKLNPEKRYTIGRSAESRNSTEMITIPDAEFFKFVSRWQAELFCIDGVWYCKSVSDKCPTYVDDRFADGDALFPLKKQKDGQVKFGGTGQSFVLYYSSSNN